jgi:hypothetical protein
VISRRRGALGEDIVEVTMMLKLNRAELVFTDPTQVPSLGTNWRAHLPKRPDYPDDYFDGDQAEEQEEEDEQATNNDQQSNNGGYESDDTAEFMLD